MSLSSLLKKCEKADRRRKSGQRRQQGGKAAQRVERSRCAMHAVYQPQPEPSCQNNMNTRPQNIVSLHRKSVFSSILLLLPQQHQKHHRPFQIRGNS